MEEIRSFIAIELPDDLKRALARLQDRLRSSTEAAVKWVGASGIHLTLKFLGNIASAQVDDVVLAIEEAAATVSPFRLESGGLGVFPNPRRVQVAWVGVGGEVSSLLQLQQRLEENLAQLGFPKEARPFTAHLTLARVRERATPEERQAFGDLIAKSSLEGQYVIPVDRLNLMKSELTRQGAIYSVLSSVELRKPL